MSHPLPGSISVNDLAKLVLALQERKVTEVYIESKDTNYAGPLGHVCNFKVVPTGYRDGGDPKAPHVEYLVRPCLDDKRPCEVLAMHSVPL